MKMANGYMSQFMSHVSKKWIFLILLFLVPLLAISGYLWLSVWRTIYPKKQCLRPDREILSLFETNLEIKIPDSAQLLSTCYNYDSAWYEWGTVVVFKAGDIDAVYEPNQWDLLSNETMDRKTFPIEMHTYEIFDDKVKWWNPNLQNLEGVYIRNQNHRSYDNRNLKMLVEKENQGWTRIFIFMHSDVECIPSPIQKLFEYQGERDILVGEKYHTIQTLYDKNQIVYNVFQPCDSNIIVSCVDHNFRLSFPDRILTSEAAITQDPYGKPSYILKVEIDSSDLDYFTKSIAETRDGWDEYFMPYDLLQDTRNKVLGARTPKWYNEKITQGWICKKNFITQGNTMNLHNLYIDTSKSSVSIVYINGRVRKDILQQSDSN